MNSAMLTFARASVGCVCLCAGVGKLQNRRASQSFVRSVTRLTGLTDVAAVILAAVTIAAELAVSLGTLCGLRLQDSFLGATVLYLGILFVTVRAVHSGDSVTCNCFGARAQAPIGVHSIVRAAVLLALATYGLAVTFDGHTQTLAVGASVLFVGLGLCLGAALVFLDGFLLLWRIPEGGKS